MLEAWRGAFPDLFTDEIPTELREHFRYPEDLFRVQTDMYSKYQLDPANFFDRPGAWSVAQAPTNDTAGARPADHAAAPCRSAEHPAASRTSPRESGSGRFVPYYTYFHPGPGEAADHS